MSGDLDFVLATVDLATTRGQYHRTARHAALRPAQQAVAAVGEAWRDDALCVGEPADVFFPDNPNAANVDYSRAQALCAVCPVQPDCLAYAVHYEIRWGWWGGMSPEQRRQHRRAS